MQTCISHITEEALMQTCISEISEAAQVQTYVKDITEEVLVQTYIKDITEEALVQTYISDIRRIVAMLRQTVFWKLEIFPFYTPCLHTPRYTQQGTGIYLSRNHAKVGQTRLPRTLCMTDSNRDAPAFTLRVE